DIRRYRDQQPISAYRVPLRHRIVHWLGHHPTVSIALILAFMFGGFAYHYRNAVAIRMMEQQKAEELERALEEQRAKGLLNDLVGAAKELTLAVQVLDERILAAEQERAGLSPADTTRRAALDVLIEELKAARLWHTYGLQAMTSAMIVLAADAPDHAPTDLDSSRLDTIRNAALEETRDLLRIGELYQAHNRVWRHLLEAQGIGWSETQTAELLELKDRIEERMRAGKGPDFELPDWDVYRPENLVPPEP
ncbi:MAG: hypothetical protein HQ548_08440, partial [Chloroflexi bacterium]|nr:hypothetical protein [Chloroflexota bacterium]